MNATAKHRPATRRRRVAHGDLVADELLSGVGRLTQPIEDCDVPTMAGHEVGRGVAVDLPGNDGALVGRIDSRPRPTQPSGAAT